MSYTPTVDGVAPLSATTSGAATAASPAPRAPQPAGLGKYREIVVAVAFFLVFDLAVLVLNFYISFRIADDAVAINLSGRQRMLSQRTAKALLEFDDSARQQRPTDAEREELARAVALFDATLKAFAQGGEVPGGDGAPVLLRAVDSAAAQRQLQAAQALWAPYREQLAPILAGNPSPEQLTQALAYARTTNVELLGLMNDLTFTLENEANRRATLLRGVQTAGILLALANFVFILFKFIRRLHASDAAVEAVDRENREILASVREGLFLITPEMRIGSQISGASDRVIGSALAPGQSFLELLRPMVSERTLTDLAEYLKLLFSPHVKEQLVRTLNPVKMLPIQVAGESGTAQTRHISFEFNRSFSGTDISHLLVTAQDVTRVVELESALADARRQGQRQQDRLLMALMANPIDIGAFARRSIDSLTTVNDLLRAIGGAQGERQALRSIDEIRRRVHAMKGEAGLLGLNHLATQAHEFEDQLAQLAQSGDIRGDRLLALPLALEVLLEELQTIERFCSRAQPAGAKTEAPPESLAQQLERLARRAAKAVGKQVELSCELDLPALSDEQQSAVREIVTQLVRNAVAHGIEPPAQRRARGKAAAGRIAVGAQTAPDGRLTLVVRDDGAGIDPQRVRARLAELGWYGTRELAALDDRQVLAHLFRPGFSTRQSIDGLAGRGVGLDVVQARAKALGGSVSVGTRIGEYAEFRVGFAL